MGGREIGSDTYQGVRRQVPVMCRESGLRDDRSDVKEFVLRRESPLKVTLDSRHVAYWVTLNYQKHTALVFKKRRYTEPEASYELKREGEKWIRAEAGWEMLMSPEDKEDSGFVTVDEAYCYDEVSLDPKFYENLKTSLRSLLPQAHMVGGSLSNIIMKDDGTWKLATTTSPRNEKRDRLQNEYTLGIALLTALADAPASPQRQEAEAFACDLLNGLANLHHEFLN